MDNPKEFRCISLCTGYAGIELGLKRVVPALRTVCYVEREGFACANLVNKIEAGELDTAPIWTDIKTFDGRPFHNRIHIITGGYPCQPFSVAGKRQGTDDPRHLWPYIERIVQAVRPIWCFFENVSGHLNIGFPEVYRSLRLMDYKIETGLFGTLEIGMLHNRERIFILAHSNLYDDKSFKTLSVNKLPIRNNKKRYWPPIWSESDRCFRNESTKGFSVKPLLDRRTDGTRNRMDRLRLLGNGVVPQQTEFAFRTLLREFE